MDLGLQGKRLRFLPRIFCFRSLPNLDLSPLRSDKLDILSYWRCGWGSHLCPRYSEASWQFS
jgi:hypothetical protein